PSVGGAWHVAPLLSRALLGALLLGLSSAASAQVAPTPSSSTSSPSAATPPGEDETIELTPFNVNADRDVGYVATSSLAGSRLNTELKDTAAAISVLTSEFLSDIGATSLTEALEW